MDVRLLLPVLVVLQVVVQQASSSALHPPRLTVHPKYPKYFEGEHIKLNCSAFQNRKVKGYRFFNQDGQKIYEMEPDPYQKAKMSFTVQLKDTGKYTCEYSMEQNGAIVTSAQSDAVSLQITEAPPAPLLTLEPNHNKYNLGDSVSLLCTVPPKVTEIKQVQYRGDRTCIISLAVSGNTHIRSMNITEPKDMGTFQCAYILQLAGRMVASKLSNPVSIDIGVTRIGWEWMLAVGVSFFFICGLIFLIFHFFPSRCR